jgi:hypothetical protein
MTIPGLPTDNLYKFKALGGLTLLIVALILYVTELDKMFSEIFTLRTDIDIENTEMDILIRARNAVDADYKEISLDIDKNKKDIAELNNNCVSDTILSKDNEFGLLFNYIKSKDKEEARRDIEFRLKHRKEFLPVIEKFDLVQKKWEENQNLKDKIKFKVIQNTGKVNYLIFKSIIFGLLSLLVIISFRFGIRLANSGFRDWKEKVQDLQDEKLKLEIKNLRESKVKEEEI